MCKTCKHTVFMTGVGCPCSNVGVSCLRCVDKACPCPVGTKYLLSWWTKDEMCRFLQTAEDYVRKLDNGQADKVLVA